MSGNIGEVLVAELRLLLAPLADAVSDELGRERFFADLGFDLSGLSVSPAEQLAAVGDAVTAALNALDQVPLPPENLDDLQPILRAAATVPVAIQELAGLISAFPPTL